MWIKTKTKLMLKKSGAVITYILKWESFVLCFSIIIIFFFLEILMFFISFVSKLMYSIVWIILLHCWQLSAITLEMVVSMTCYIGRHYNLTVDKCISHRWSYGLINSYCTNPREFKRIVLLTQNIVVCVSY